MVSPIDSSFNAKSGAEAAQLKQLAFRLDKAPESDPQKLRKAAQDLEAVFMRQLLDAMDKTVERNDFMDGGSAEETFRGMLYEEISNNITHRPAGSGLGLADAIYREVSKTFSHQPTEASGQPGQPQNGSTTVDVKG